MRSWLWTNCPTKGKGGIEAKFAFDGLKVRTGAPEQSVNGAADKKALADTRRHSQIVCTRPKISSYHTSKRSLIFNERRLKVSGL